MSAQHPTTARITSLSHWTHLFHPQTGIFRLPNTTGVPIEHLDIDLRFIEHDRTESQPPKAKSSILPAQIEDVYLPNVCTLTLRGAEHVQDSEERMDCLAEVLCAINPVEVQWLNAAEDPNEMLTFSTHMVHPAVIAAGERWTRLGPLRKLVIQGGFPCPNLTAPTPFSLTPAATPASSPGLHKTTLGSFMSMGGLTGLPTLSTNKLKPVNEAKAKERAERKRLAEYSLKPRFQYAFGTWGVDEVRWRLDGRYTSACILAIIENLLNALDKTYPFGSIKVDMNLPSLFAFTCIPTNIIETLKALQTKLDLDSDFVEYLEDCFLISTPSHPMNYSRIFHSTTNNEANLGGERKARRMKAEMLLLQEKGLKIVDPAYQLEGGETLGAETSLEDSMASLSHSHEKESSGEEDQAVTPELEDSAFMVFENGVDVGGEKGSKRGTGDWTEVVGQGPLASRH